MLLFSILMVCGLCFLSKLIREMIRRGYSGYMSVELSPEIGENGDFIPFTDEDRRKPHIMFSRYESI